MLTWQAVEDHRGGVQLPVRWLHPHLPGEVLSTLIAYMQRQGQQPEGDRALLRAITAAAARVVAAEVSESMYAGA